MNIVVIGLGSMGKRRICIIREIYPEYVIVGIDEKEERRDEAGDMFSISCYAAASEIDETVDCAFICTSPLSHALIISDCLKRGWHQNKEMR